VGPASEHPETLKRLITAGMDVARFNFSHGSHDEHGRRIGRVRKAAQEVGKRVGIMLDTKGPEIRLGLFQGGKASLAKGEAFVLYTGERMGNSQGASVSYPGFPDLVRRGSTVLLDDGNIGLEVKDVSRDEVACVVLNSGIIKDRKRISIPGAQLDIPMLDSKDRDDLLYGARLGVDFVAASFVRSRQDVLDIRRVLVEAGSRAKIIAKIESCQGVQALSEILEEADGLMIARGDLGVEFPPEEIPLLQKSMIAQALSVGKPVITATQMLESMVEHPRPTRAEASDVANAILDGTDAVMLSAETAAGKYPVEAVGFMARIATRTEASLNPSLFIPKLIRGSVSDVTQAVSRSVIAAADELGAAAIVTPTESGHTARMVARFRPKMPVYAVTPHDETAGWLSLTWGVEATVCPQIASGQEEDVSEASLQALMAKRLVTAGDLCVITKGVPKGIAGTTNAMEIRSAGN
jgi:pyruvate kinase